MSEEMYHKYELLFVDTDGTALGVPCKEHPNNKDEVSNKIKELNEKWRNILNFDDFELEDEEAVFELHVKHKNYAFAEDKLETPDDIDTKGNNFDASNKPKVSVDTMKSVIFRFITESGDWCNISKEEQREKNKELLKQITSEEVAKIDLENKPIEDLTMYENIAPVSRYKDKNSVYALRTQAIERVIGRQLEFGIKLATVVCKEPLPKIPHDKLSNKGTKALHYMYPKDYINKDQIDLNWYKDSTEKYILGALGINQEKSSKNSGKKLAKDQLDFSAFM